MFKIDDQEKPFGDEADSLEHEVVAPGVVVDDGEELALGFHAGIDN